MALVESHRHTASQKLDPQTRLEKGQFLTPAVIARLMASMLTERPERLALVDPGAGAGALTAACIAELEQWNHRPRTVRVVAYEVEPRLVPYLQDTLRECAVLCQRLGVEFEATVHETDFIRALSGYFAHGALFTYDTPRYNCAVLNPPYRKIRSTSGARKLLMRMGIPANNLYSAFVWLTTRLLEPGGEMVAITPRSFCNGPYFNSFRKELLRTMSLRRIHVFESRTRGFEDDAVLQENVILHAVRSDTPPESVVISTSASPSDETPTVNEVAYDRVVHPEDRGNFIHLLPDDMASDIGEMMQTFETSLSELGLAVSTGRVVDFRARPMLREHDAANVVPLVYPAHFERGFVQWPASSFRKPDSLALTDSSIDLLVPSKPYVLVKRFTSKEERRRVTAAVFDPARIQAAHIGFENHLNYFHSDDPDFSLDMAKGLAVYLNSTLVDEYFRQFSGHTQVNATDLRSLKYPRKEELLSLGRSVGQHLPDQDQIDSLVEKELGNMKERRSKTNPLKAKRKLKEAREILEALGLPRQQQNDRSSLTLLALLSMRPGTPWSRAKSTLLGITEMMDYFAEHFGVRYAPNTRETVRRQTVHQFVQAGLVVANPDKPSRPTNSPDNRYRIEESTLTLVKTFGTPAWPQKLASHVRAADSLRALQATERTKALVPVRLPDGRVLKLGSGRHNQLIKQVIEVFCPQYAPGGIVVCLGDAADKMKGSNLDYLQRLGVTVDKHGKMPDVAVHHAVKNWLLLVEAVTSHGPMSIKRHNELKAMFSQSRAGLVFVTAFPSRTEMRRHLADIAWETEVWVADSPTHLIHFDGERYLGPY